MLGYVAKHHNVGNIVQCNPAQGRRVVEIAKVRNTGLFKAPAPLQKLLNRGHLNIASERRLTASSQVLR